ncbi:hypothetical protein [Janibacter anophelis]|uniref:hypothetical protein n=1 Tax=Janibacter anophelis TaxID=319054 RepID=UPI000A8292ED|nr:hypothetical protein [Janibacter anophelis]
MAELARDWDRPHSRVQNELTATALALIAAHLEDLPRWVQARSSGLGDEAIADLSGTMACVVALALDGWPVSGLPDIGDAVKALRRWSAGEPVSQVAGALGVPVARLRRQLVEGHSELTPRRLTTSDLGARYGWTPSAISQYRRKGTLPAVDGLEGSRAWWWEATIDSWENARELHWCRECEHAFVAVSGLKEHSTRIHGC